MMVVLSFQTKVSSASIKTHAKGRRIRRLGYALMLIQEKGGKDESRSVAIPARVYWVNSVVAEDYSATRPSSSMRSCISSMPSSTVSSRVMMAV